MQRHHGLGLGQRLGIGRVPRPIGQAFADPDQQLGQVHSFVTKLRFVTNLFQHLPGRFERRRPGRAIR